jgi:TolB-like protein
MPSLIPGYEYDIFISYRQKDNKHDGWVTEFVNNLKGELESTFKEEISVYFDINPHDGLLETHDVDESLKNKLKCLVFIPIISRTYCDPKAFAWVHEFRAFLEQASEDQFGLKVKVPGGNVASRVLPIQIHDLNIDDKKLVESELGGFLRGIEFIYKEPGVNRPLTPDDDEKKNLNGTKYKNQINKVANAISEIIDGIKNADHSEKEISEKIVEVKSLGKKNQKRTIIIGSVIALALIIIGIIFVPKLLRPSGPLEKSIAVLPFKLLSNEPDKQYLADGMMDAITLHLSKIKDLRVLGRTSTEQYRNPTKTLIDIGKDLDVGYLLEGSFQKFGDSVRLIVKLIKTGKEGHVWANNYDRLWKNVFSVQSEVAQSVARELKAAITPEEKQLIEKTPTASLDAYDFYQRGSEEYSKYLYDNNKKDALKNARDLYLKTLEFDSLYAPAYAGLARVYSDMSYWKTYFTKNFQDSVLILAGKAISLDDQLADAYTVRGDYYRVAGNTEQAIKEYDKAIKFNPNAWEAYYGKGRLYGDLVETIKCYQIAASLNRGNELPFILGNLGAEYANSGFPDKCTAYAQEVLKLTGDSLYFYYWLGATETGLSGNHPKAINYLKKAYAIDTNYAEILHYLGYAYMFSHEYKESLFYYKKYIERLKVLGNLNINEMHRIAYVYWQNGYKKEADYYFDKQIEFANSEIRLNRSRSGEQFLSYYDLAGVYAFRGEKEKAYENLRIFNQRKTEQLWMVTLIKMDPLFDSIRNEPEFQQIVRDVEVKYQVEHERVRKWLEEQGKL